MHSLPFFTALLAASGSLASPLKPRSLNVVDVYDFVTVVEVVTVTAAPVVTTLHEEVLVTEAPVVVLVTATVKETAAPAPDSTESTSPTAPVNQPAAQPTSAPAQTPQSSSLRPQIDTSTIATNAEQNVPATSSSVPVPAPSATSVAAEAVAVQKPSQAAADLPSNTIIYDLQPTSSTYKKLALYSHNVHRQNHTNTKNLVYNSTLESYAKEKAQSCIWDEDLPADAEAANVGMNMAEGTYIGAANITTIISDMWYNGEIDIFPGYDIPDPSMTKFDQWGHFTQVIWRDTTSVGCWSSACSRNDGTANEIGTGYFTVCTYWPPANVPGEYADQIGNPEGHAIVTGV